MAQFIARDDRNYARKNVAFKVKLFCESMTWIDIDKWNDERGICEDSFELGEMLSLVNNLLYTGT